MGTHEEWALRAGESEDLLCCGCGIWYSDLYGDTCPECGSEEYLTEGDVNELEKGEDHE